MEKYQLLPESLHSRALQHSLNNLDCELAGQSTDDPECIDGKWLSLPLLYCLHIERHKNQPDDFNIHHLRGWRYGDMIVAFAEKNSCLLYKAWQHLMRTRFQGLEEGSASSKVELVDLTTPEPTHNDCSSNVSTPPIIDLVTPEPVPVVDLRTPEPGQLVVSVVDLSTPEPEQLAPALSVSARALLMAQRRPLGLQLLTPDLRRCLLNRRPHPRQNLITVGMAYHCNTHSERPYRQKWYYVEKRLLLKAVMAGFAGFLGLNVESLYFWLYGHAIKPDETVDNLGMEEGDIIEVESQ